METHFGYETVGKDDKVHRVAQVFDSVAEQYDLMNDLTSVGLHRFWKAFTVAQAGVRSGFRILDIAGGTGDLSAAFAKAAGKNGEVWLTDINENMLRLGRDKLLNQGRIVPVAVCDAENLPFPENRFDRVVVSFGLRNMTDKQRALSEMYRVLKRGGKLLILEFSQVSPFLRKIYDKYSFSFLPWLGERITGDGDSYRYLAESIRMHPNQETLKEMMREANFNLVKYFNLTGGVVALHTGIKV